MAMPGFLGVLAAYAFVVQISRVPSNVNAMVA
jgi:hypothetical protein